MGKSLSEWMRKKKMDFCHYCKTRNCRNGSMKLRQQAIQKKHCRKREQENKLAIERAIIGNKLSNNALSKKTTTNQPQRQRISERESKWITITKTTMTTKREE